MKINTPQTILFRLLREVNARHRQEKPTPPDSGHVHKGAPPSPLPRDKRVFPKLRHALESLNDWLAAYYQLCSHVGFGAPEAEVQTMNLRPNEVVRLTQDDRANHLEVRRGIIWLSRTPARGDALLRDGDEISPAGSLPCHVQARG
jgi:hypothetical protein